MKTGEYFCTLNSYSVPINYKTNLPYMKTTAVSLLLVFLLFYACGVQRESTVPANDNSVEIAAPDSDTTEYEVVIFDPDFDIWFATNSRPISYYDEGYLKNWNERLVQQWNSFSSSRGRFDCRPMTYLDYDSSIDYGKELNYRLFYYFRFMQERCRIFHSRPGEWRR
jgi:hypothetical protein